MGPQRRSAVMAESGTDPLGAVAQDLYGLAPDEFIAARTAAEKKAKAAGDRDLAGRIHALTKPTTVAWLANQLVRQHPDETGPLLDLGAALREATASLSGDQLRQLSKQQYQVINALVRQARAISISAGYQLTDATSRGLEGTLRAALAENELADQLAAGQLSRGLEHSGFSGLGGFAEPTESQKAAAAKSPKAATSITPEERKAQVRKKAEQALGEAQQEADRSAAARKDAQLAMDLAAGTVADLATGIEQLKAQLDEATRDHQRAERAERETREVLERAERAAHRAERALEPLKAERDNLG